MNIKTLSEISSILPCTLVRDPQRVADHMSREIWLALERSLVTLQPTKASLVLDLGEHRKDPVRILAMLLLNLSQKELLELREALGIPELTLLS